ncbi:MAG: hypothetical protein NBV67_06905, partial [Tagaea sp.]|nr:hypothetical protein [Tagaea sp.]
RAGGASRAGPVGRRAGRIANPLKTRDSRKTRKNRAKSSRARFTQNGVTHEVRFSESSSL